MKKSTKKTILISVVVISYLGVFLFMILFMLEGFKVMSVQRDPFNSSPTGFSFNVGYLIGFIVCAIIGTICLWILFLKYGVRFLGRTFGHGIADSKPKIDDELAKIEKLKNDNKINDEEYQKMRNKILGLDK